MGQESWRLDRRPGLYCVCNYSTGYVTIVRSLALKIIGKFANHKHLHLNHEQYIYILCNIIYTHDSGFIFICTRNLL